MRPSYLVLGKLGGIIEGAHAAETRLAQELEHGDRARKARLERPDEADGSNHLLDGGASSSADWHQAQGRSPGL